MADASISVTGTMSMSLLQDELKRKNEMLEQNISKAFISAYLRFNLRPAE
jgi:hypothetical protein